MLNDKIVFFDIETGGDEKIYDIGAIKFDGSILHCKIRDDFYKFTYDCDFLCGHNVFEHDLKFLKNKDNKIVIDTLYLSALLFPKRPYHALLKEEKLISEELNNPVNDSKKAQKLFYDEINEFFDLSIEMQDIFVSLLSTEEVFSGFFNYIGCTKKTLNLCELIGKVFKGRICSNVDIEEFIYNKPIELAYTLALINAGDHYSVTPYWLRNKYPEIENVLKVLCNIPCKVGCEYCNGNLSIHKGLNDYFGYDSFRTYDGEPLQEKAANAAVKGDSLLAIFPTGGGKSITFQLPALIAGRTMHGLTVVISPLQSLMKDQVDNLNNIGITEAVTINGLLNPIERANAIERVENGTASILYISPETLRSRTIERLLLKRNIARFVIDEAHCFSSWGHDFRVDYLYIGDFIKRIKEKKRNNTDIPISCFTATAKQKVISDICDYFREKLNLNLQIFAATSSRENLKYTVLFQETDDDKYNTLRNLILERDCPTIVYVSRTKKAVKLAERLSMDGFNARPFHGKLASDEKITTQEMFINNEINIIVATSAFGMGVDKKDIRLVIHYDISTSLEDYIQESGRAGRDPFINAECYVLFNDMDLDKHFILLNQNKLSINEIQQVWKAVKDLTKEKKYFYASPLEIARAAGWDNTITDVETRVKTAISNLEISGYLIRGRNMPRIYASSISVSNMEEASKRINESTIFNDAEKLSSKRIMSSLISKRRITKAQGDDPESRIDYLADILGLDKKEVISVINLMRQEGILADYQDMTAFITENDKVSRTENQLEKFSKLEYFLLEQFDEGKINFNIKELNDIAHSNGLVFSKVKDIKTIIYYMEIMNYVKNNEYASSGNMHISCNQDVKKLIENYKKRIHICEFIVKELYHKADYHSRNGSIVGFSLVGLYNEYMETPQPLHLNFNIKLKDIEDALLYLSKIGVLKLEGGFLVLYNSMEIRRIVLDNRIKYKFEDYRLLDEYYKQKILQIHIVGEYANIMVKDYNEALQFINDYFQMDFRKFITKYFKGERIKEIYKCITPKKYNEIFGELSDIQSQIINDFMSKYIVVAAGPGSGKTMVLVHKLASLLLMEDVKHEQLLMLTFSRAAATEFKKRLIKLIGGAAHYVEIKTFHSYCFDLIGKMGNLQDSSDVVRRATTMILNGEVEKGKVTKTVLVIDEAQDMDMDEFALVEALIKVNEEMRIIAVGDDDQNIYEFRGANSKYMRRLIDKYGATMYEMTENYRSKEKIVEYSNDFVKRLRNRMKTSIIEPHKEGGIVLATKYKSDNIEKAVVNQISKTMNNNQCCVLTRTNDEALQVLGLLIKSGIKAQLIQSIEGFKLHNIIEIRYFLDTIDKNLNSPVISDELWEFAKEKMNYKYSQSACLNLCNKIINEFNSINKNKYRSDLKEYISESKLEDFYEKEAGTVYVSTIHKSKGKEFDNVYLLYKNREFIDDAENRAIYVGMTRAKNGLYIHTNSDLFTCDTIDNNEYGEFEELSLQLSHRDVVLSFFHSRTNIVKSLYSGMNLEIDSTYFYTYNNYRRIPVVKHSMAFKRKLEILEKKDMYHISLKLDIFYIGKEKGKQRKFLLFYLMYILKR